MSTVLSSGFEVYADRSIRSRSIDLHLVMQEAGHTVYALPLSVKRVESDGLEAREVGAEPFLRLGFEQAEALMCELWKAGIRIEREFGDGERTAMKAHVAALEAEVLFLRSLVTHHAGIVR